MTLITDTGPAAVLHRLALGIECLDAVADRLVLPSIRVGREAARQVRPEPRPANWPCIDVQRSGPARFKLRHHPTLPGEFVLRFDDLDRRYVPRRLTVHPWPPSALEEDQPYVPVRARMLRTWLWPGSAYPMPRGTTYIRGRVARGVLGVPARWARLAAVAQTGDVAGRAHADERGEFVMVITDPAQNPLQSSVAVDVVVTARRVPPAVDPLDRCADLVAEDVPQSVLPPNPHDVDNATLRGVAVPDGYAPSVSGPIPLVVPTGGGLTLTQDIVFQPAP